MLWFLAFTLEFNLCKFLCLIWPHPDHCQVKGTTKSAVFTEVSWTVSKIQGLSLGLGSGRLWEAPLCLNHTSKSESVCFIGSFYLIVWLTFEIFMSVWVGIDAGLILGQFFIFEAFAEVFGTFCCFSTPKMPAVFSRSYPYFLLSHLIVCWFQDGRLLSLAILWNIWSQSDHWHWF